MRRLIEFLLQNPILAFVAVAWIAGILGNLAKAAKRRQQQTTLPPAAPPRPVESAPDAEAVAREMRRILGQSEEDARQREREERQREREAQRQAPVVREQVLREPVDGRFEPPALPSRTPPALPSGRLRSRVEPERPPTPVVPTVTTRRLPSQVESHVGETLAQRHVRTSAVPHGLGTLGGRSPHVTGRREEARRFALDDLKRAFVLSEILGPPLSSRRERELGP